MHLRERADRERPGRERVVADGALERGAGRGDGRVDVVPDALAAEGVAARARRDRVGGVLVAEVADGCRRRGRRPAAPLLDGALGVHHEVRVVDRLAEPRQQVEDVRVVVEQGAGLDVGAKLGLRLRVDGLVKVHLRVVEEVGLERDELGRENHLLRAPLLGAPQQALVEHLALERHKRVAAGADVAILADRVDDVAVEARVVLHRPVAAVLALGVVGVEPVLAALAVAAGRLAKVVGVRLEPEERDQRVELADAVLQRRAREAPAVLCV
mmetsp:Transcript_12173/g.38977  ORF Transcript_12173/g.38977 Transcript_12173/m.38977 type:complete len:270 (+) Transcript_12173:215-1024(+)